MRFFADGPNIPEILLEDRDNGNVVFFCGAGVSRPAGLPGFLDLAEQVVQELGAPPEAKVRTALARAKIEPDGAVPLDQIFSILQQEYRSANIDDIVSKLLKTPTSANVDQHQIVLRLSKNAANQTQIVTTNFDLLFERAQKGLQRHVAPALPDLSSGQPLRGLVYLHGRLNQHPAPGTDPHQLILSSSDFGRAYLADGWATRFVRDLLRNYVIVLLGYSANDPPVRYLLEGLHSRAGISSAGIYAFDQGSEAEVRDRWRNRGVVPLAYPVSSAHSALWNTLRAWADRADDPEQWRKSILALASNNPRQLTSYQRGQVVSLARTTEGAKLFANAIPPPPAEWICVFDRTIRHGEPGNGEKSNDPLEIYGLDDDPPRPKEGEENGAVGPTDVLSPSLFDERKREYSRLAGVSDHSANPLSPRLFYLSRWFARVLNEPASTWWAAGYISLHSGLINQIEWSLDHSNLELDAKARHHWELLLQKFAESSRQRGHQHHVLTKISRRGWSPQLHYELEESIRPFLKSKRPNRTGPIPPQGKYGEIDAGLVINLEVEFPALGTNELKLPSEQLYRCFRSVRRGLEKAETLLRSLQVRFWRTSNFQSDNRPGDRYLSGSDKYLFWAKDLFDQLAHQFPGLARTEVYLWPQAGEYFFDKLKIYAWTNASLFSGEVTGSGLLNLQEKSFWDGYNRRELLHLLRSRWNDMPANIRESIEERIIAGQINKKEEDADKFRRRQASTAASMLGWLRLNGCALSENTAGRLPEIQSIDPQWSAKWELSADQSLDGRSGYVEVKADPTKIIDLPISQVIEVAEQESARPRFMEFTEHRPFSGLVRQRPQRALAALAYQARHNKFPVNFWEAALSDWPVQLPERLQWLFAARLARLPNEILFKLPHYASSWLKKYLPALAQKNPEQALAVWDAILNGLCSGGSENLDSGMGDALVSGKPQNLSRRTYDHAINGPIGAMADVLFQILDGRKLNSGSGVPSDIRERLERLLEAPGEGADHAISETAIRMTWLHYIDPNWVAERLIPMFAVDDSKAEPAWSGFLHSDSLGGAQLFGLIKPHFLNVFEKLPAWRWDDQATDRLHEFLVITCYWNRKSRPYVSFDEARLALQRSSDDGRSHSIWFLGQIISDQGAWRSFGKPFIIRAWPKETRYQTNSTSRQFATIAEASDDVFPDVVRTIGPFLVPSTQLDLFVYRAAGKGEGEHKNLPNRFPAAMLALLDRLVPDDPNLAPYELSSIVATIVDSDASLRQDPRWRRLNRIIHAR